MRSLLSTRRYRRYFSLQMMASSSKAKTTFYTASSLCDALETDEDASELEGDTLFVRESDDEEA